MDKGGMRILKEAQQVAQVAGMAQQPLGTPVGKLADGKGQRDWIHGDNIRTPRFGG